MPTRGPKGSVTRGVPDWLYSRLQGANGATVGTAGTLAASELFNNATDGSYLFVYGIITKTASFANITPTSYHGQLGTPSVHFSMLQFDQPQGPGIYGGYNTVVAINTEFTVFPSLGAQAWWPYDFPAAIIPPGWSMGLQCDTLNVTVWTGCSWVAISPP